MPSGFTGIAFNNDAVLAPWIENGVGYIIESGSTYSGNPSWDGSSNDGWAAGQLALLPSTGPGELPNGTVGQAYSQTIAATGGTGSDSFAVTSGTLPTGLNLSTSGR